MKLLSARNVLARIALIIACAEALVMVLLQFNPHIAGGYLAAVLDALLLALLSTPPLYYWVIRPFVKARDEALEQVTLLAHTDPLTHLANRRLVRHYLGTLVAGSVRHGTVGAVLVMDLDGFKAINDRHGHDAGDATLVEVARRLREVVRSEDVVGRLGGDEFVVLVHRFDGPNSEAGERALRIAEKLIRAVDAPVPFNGLALRVGASVGIRLLPPEHLEPDAAIAEADQAMYRAKALGRGRAEVFGGEGPRRERE
ncbi:MAG: GGDEF domain-containing protein [Rhizobium sp.]|nr:GGDEF domain-containing protein [Rhizobium sp.]